MYERRPCQPWHEGGVLDRVPEPESTPTELVIGPEAAESNAAGEERPGGGRPRPRPACPVLIEPALEHRRAGEGERDREAHVARIEDGRMHGEPRILQDWIEVAAVGCGRIESQERVRGRERK